MNYKTVQRVHSLYEQLKALDDEINKIEKLAIYVSENKATINLDIAGYKNKADQVKPVLDAEGSLLNAEQQSAFDPRTFRNIYERYAFLGGEHYTNTPKPDFDLSYTMHEGLCLSVLDVLIRDMNTKRKSITDELRVIFNQ